MKVIALAGKKQSGKDTVFQLARDLFIKEGGAPLVKTTNEQVVKLNADISLGVPVQSRIGRVAFGDSIKHELSKITGFRVEHIEENKKDFRSLLQVWGTDFRRKLCGDDYWLKKMAGIIEQSTNHYDVLFITDCRFGNEAAFIKEMGGKIIRVERRVQVHNLTDLPDLDPHSSETDLDDYDYDYVLNNDKTPDDLSKSVETMLITLGLLKNAS